MRSRWHNSVTRRRTVLAAASGAVAIPLAGFVLATAQPAGHGTTPSIAVDARSTTEVDTTVVVRTTGSNLSFEPNQLVFKEGTRVRIRYENAGGLPHNFLVLKNRGDIDAIGIAALDAAGTEYVPQQFGDKIIASSTLAVPGESVEVTFTVPPAGEYPFVCTYPGHFRAMQGVIRSRQ